MLNTTSPDWKRRDACARLIPAALVQRDGAQLDALFRRTLVRLARPSAASTNPHGYDARLSHACSRLASAMRVRAPRASMECASPHAHNGADIAAHSKQQGAPLRASRGAVLLPLRGDAPW